MAVYYACYEFGTRYMFAPFDSLDPEELEEDDEEEYLEPMFLPFPGTYKELKPKPYAANDPEWRCFVKFSKDKDEAKRARDELAAYVLKLASTHPVLALHGKEMKLRRYWLDVDFPTFAPPEWERSGIEFPFDGLPRWTTRKVDSLLVAKIQSVMWPTPLLQATWAFTKVAMLDALGSAAGMLGLRSGSQVPTQLSMEQIIARHQQMAKNPQMPSENGPPPQSTAISSGPKTIGPGGNSGQQPLTTKGKEEFELSTKPGSNVDSHFFRPVMAFKATLAQKWRPAKGHPPRGCILVSGLVEVDSPKAWMVFDVRAAYDPKTREYDGRTLNVSLRRHQPKRQGPVSPRPPVMPSLPPNPPQAGRPY